MCVSFASETDGIEVTGECFALTLDVVFFSGIWFWIRFLLNILLQAHLSTQQYFFGLWVTSE
jgi:hypothetical protein